MNFKSFLDQERIPMQSAKRYLVIALSFAVCLTIFAAFTPRIAHAITATLVQVVNTATNPVPVQAVGNTPVQGTVGIDPANNAVQVTSLPAVQLGSNSSVSLENNTPAQPLFTSDVTDATRQYTAWNVNDSWGEANLAPKTLYFRDSRGALEHVPDGKRLVIEDVSGAIATPGATIIRVYLSTWFNGQTGDDPIVEDIPVTLMGVFGSGATEIKYYSFQARTKLIADHNGQQPSDATLTVEWIGGVIDGAMSVNSVVRGYFVDCPASGCRAMQ
jgi:hypothetical protein